jgi:hypothetical protein
MIAALVRRAVPAAQERGDGGFREIALGAMLDAGVDGPVDLVVGRQEVEAAIDGAAQPLDEPVFRHRLDA